MTTKQEMIEMRERLQRRISEAISEFEEGSGTLVKELVVQGAITRTVSGESWSGDARMEIEVELP